MDQSPANQLPWERESYIGHLHFIRAWLQYLERHEPDPKKRVLRVLWDNADLDELHAGLTGSSTPPKKRERGVVRKKQHWILNRFEQYQTMRDAGVRFGPAPMFAHPIRFQMREEWSFLWGDVRKSPFNGDLEVLYRYKGHVEEIEEVRELFIGMLKILPRKGVRDMEPLECDSDVLLFVSWLYKAQEHVYGTNGDIPRVLSGTALEVVSSALHKQENEVVEMHRLLMEDYEVYRALVDQFFVDFRAKELFVYPESADLRVHSSYFKVYGQLPQFQRFTNRSDNRDLEYLWRWGQDKKAKRVTPSIGHKGNETVQPTPQQPPPAAEYNLSLKFDKVGNAVLLLMPHEKSSELLATVSRQELVKTLYHLLPIPDVLLATAEALLEMNRSILNPT